MKSIVFISKQVNTEPDLRIGRIGVNFIGSQEREYNKTKQNKKKRRPFCLFESQICFFLEVVRDHFFRNFLESLEVSRVRGEEAASVPKAKPKQTLGLDK